jgi:hypothetical protein
MYNSFTQPKSNKIMSFARKWYAEDHHVKW